MSIKEAYEQRLDAQLKQWKAEIDKLSAKAKVAEADARLQYNREIQELQRLQQQADKQLSELKAASDEAWEDIKAGSEKASAALSQALQSAKSRFK